LSTGSLPNLALGSCNHPPEHLLDAAPTQSSSSHHASRHTEGSTEAVPAAAAAARAVGVHGLGNEYEEEGRTNKGSSSHKSHMHQVQIAEGAKS